MGMASIYNYQMEPELPQVSFDEFKIIPKDTLKCEYGHVESISNDDIKCVLSQGIVPFNGSEKVFYIDRLPRTLFVNDGADILVGDYVIITHLHEISKNRSRHITDCNIWSPTKDKK